MPSVLPARSKASVKEKDEGGKKKKTPEDCLVFESLKRRCVS